MNIHIIRVLCCVNNQDIRTHNASADEIRTITIILLLVSFQIMIFHVALSMAIETLYRLLVAPRHGPTLFLAL